MIRDYVAVSTKPKPSKIVLQLQEDQRARKIDASLELPNARQVSSFMSTLSKSMGEIRNFQDLLYWSNNKLCDTTTKYHKWTDLSSIMVLETPKFDRVEEVNEEGQTVTKSTVCILVSSKQLLEYARNALFTNDLEPIDSALKMDVTFKLVNNGWLLSPMCSETARFEPPCESYKGLKRTGHKHVVLPIAFLIHTTKSSVPYQHSLKCLLNMPVRTLGFRIIPSSHSSGLWQITADRLRMQ